MSDVIALNAGPAGTGDAAVVQSRSLTQLRTRTSYALLGYYWLAAVLACLAARWFGASVLALVLPFAAIGIVTTAYVFKDPAGLATRLVVTVAINSTWMFGLYVASGIHGGAYMLEVHMLYFINGSLVLAYACWRSVLLTTVAALSHHLFLSVFDPSLVWPQDSYTWVHFMNHAVLGSANCVGGMFAATVFKRYLERLEASARAEKYRARRDDLTGLLNRRGLQDRIDKALSAGKIADWVLVQIDLDCFKDVNDTYGHAVGDRLLVQISRKLEALAPDDAVIARIGGDEFIVLFPRRDTAAAGAFISDFQDFSARPMEIDGCRVNFGASMGVTDTKISGHAFEDLLIDGDIALYEAKRAGKNKAFMFSASLRETSIQQRQLEEDVLRALEQREFVPFFQTQHVASSGGLAGAEVLARWLHPVHGLLGPGDFMPALERLGRMAHFDQLIHDQAIAFVARCEEAGLAVPKIAVNVSYERLLDPELKDRVADLSRLKTPFAFEIVESVVFDDFSEDELSAIDFFRQNGVSVELDDFGTGRASITALTSLRPDIVKIDRALIAPLTENPEQYSLIKSIIEMAHGLEIKALAEGVEHAHEIARLRLLGVDFLQGFYYSRPMPAADYEALLASGPEHRDKVIPILE